MLTPEEETKAAETSTPLEKGVSGVQTGAGDVIDSFLTPLGIATLGAGGLPKVAQRLIAGTFAAQMATQLPGQYSELKKAVKEGDVEKSSRLATELLGSAAMTGMAGKHALSRGATVPGNNQAGTIHDAGSDGRTCGDARRPLYRPNYSRRRRCCRARRRKQQKYNQQRRFKMPAVSKKQQKFMALCAHNPGAAQGKCPSHKVSEEFSHKPAGGYGKKEKIRRPGHNLNHMR